MNRAPLIGVAGIDGVAPAMKVMQAVFDPAWGEAWSEEQLTNFVARASSKLLLAIHPDDPAWPVVGFALIRVVAGEAELMLLGVLAEHRRAGVASALLGGAYAAAASNGAETMFLEVRANNDAARLLYQRAGFAIIGRRPGYYRGADGLAYDAITYSKPLS